MIKKPCCSRFSLYNFFSSNYSKKVLLQGPCSLRCVSRGLTVLKIFEQNLCALVYCAMRQCRRVDDNEVSCKEWSFHYGSITNDLFLYTFQVRTHYIYKVHSTSMYKVHERHKKSRIFTTIKSPDFVYLLTLIGSWVMNG